MKLNTYLHWLVGLAFKLPYVNDQLIYNDNNDKNKGYILKDGSYSKKLRVSSLKKSRVDWE